MIDWVLWGVIGLAALALTFLAAATVVAIWGSYLDYRYNPHSKLREWD